MMTDTTKLSREEQSKLEKMLHLQKEMNKVFKEALAKLPVDVHGRPVPDKSQLCAFLNKISPSSNSFSTLVDDMLITADGAGEDHATSTPLMKIRNIVRELTVDCDKKSAAEEDILQAAAELDVGPAEAKEALEALQLACHIYSPHDGKYAPVMESIRPSSW